MKTRKKVKKLVALIKNSLRILCVIIFFHWIFWATTYARAPQYHEAISPEKNKEITRHEQKTSKYNGAGWLSKKTEMTIGEIEEDVIKQIESETGKKNLPREWTKQLPKIENLNQEIIELRKKENKSKDEQEELTQKEKDYQVKLTEIKEKIIVNIKDQLKENNLRITELNDQRGLIEKLLIDPLKFFLVSPLNKASKISKIDTFFWAEIIFKIAVVKLFCLWLTYPESISSRIQENLQKIQNPQLSVEEREQLQRETSSLSKYWIFNGIVYFFFPMFFFFHPAHLDRTSGPFLKKVPYPYLLVPLLIIPFLLSAFSSESLRQGQTLSRQEIKTYFTKTWFILILIFILSSLFAWQNQGNYWWILVGFGIDFLFNSIRIRFLCSKASSPSFTFKVTRVKGNPNS